MKDANKKKKLKGLRLFKKKILEGLLQFSVMLKDGNIKNKM